MTRPIQRVGHIGDRDNRFCGHSVFGELAHTTRNPTDLLLLAFGVRVADADVDLLRFMSLAVCSPDSRVWPLKMTRVLSSYGNPVAGVFGAQLGNSSDKMGPGTAANAATSLQWIAAEVGPDADQEAVAAAVARHLAERGRIAGFGVPFRAEDERLVALRPMIAGHAAMQRPMWRLFEKVEAVMRSRHQLPPNIVIAEAALMLDLGVAAHRAGVLLGLLMAPNFVAHALEASEQDGPVLQALPDDAIDYQGTAARRSPAEAARVSVRSSAVASARRSLAW